MLQPTDEEFAALLMKLRENDHDIDFMSPDMITAIETIVAQGKLEHRVASGFALGFLCGRDFEAGQWLNLALGGEG